MKITWIIPVSFLVASPALGAFPKMESTSFMITSSEFSAMGKYKAGERFNTWDTSGQPSPIGAWPGSGNHSGAGWAYTINLPVWWDKDRDKDGMPTAWEEQFARWTDPDFTVHTMWDYNPMDAVEDWDGDGFVNIQEFLARTSPIDNTSFFQFTDIRVATSEGEPLLIWRNPTIRIDGFESEYPDYVRSLSYDILYADWPTQSQAALAFPSTNWFNLTGTWQLHTSGTGLKREGDFNYFTDTTLLADLGHGDIRFYRMAIGGTWLEGEPTMEAAGTWRYYTEMGEFRLASTLAKEVMMVQRQNIRSGERQVMMGLPGVVPGSGGVLDYSLGTAVFPSGSTAAEATKFELWHAQTGDWTIDFLSDYEWKDGDTTGPSTRTISGPGGFRLRSKDDPSDPDKLLPFPDITLFVGARLKMDSYFQWIHRRSSGTPVVRPGDPDWENEVRTSFLNYNFPVNQRFNEVDFPNLAGTTDPLYPGWAWLESDWVVLYDRDLSAIGGRSNEPVVVIYQDHTPTGAGQWKYLTPASVWGLTVGNELRLSAGSPVVVMQYWYPDEPATWNSNTWSFDVPYQGSGSNEIKTYLKWVDD